MLLRVKWKNKFQIFHWNKIAISLLKLIAFFIDDFILRDPDPHYRVLDLSIPTFQSADASAFHKTIGGYHAAKLKRFQEVVDKQFTGSINQDVLDMLNTKYFITPANEQGGEPSMKVNDSACGNAWFVSGIQYADNADQEMLAISSFNPKKEAIVKIIILATFW